MCDAELESQSAVATMQSCGHAFCTDCLLTWLMNLDNFEDFRGAQAYLCPILGCASYCSVSCKKTRVVGGQRVVTSDIASSAFLRKPGENASARWARDAVGEDPADTAGESFVLRLSGFTAESGRAPADMRFKFSPSADPVTARSMLGVLGLFLRDRFFVPLRNTLRAGLGTAPSYDVMMRSIAESTQSLVMAFIMPLATGLLASPPYAQFRRWSAEGEQAMCRPFVQAYNIASLVGDSFTHHVRWPMQDFLCTRLAAYGPRVAPAFKDTLVRIGLSPKVEHLTMSSLARKQLDEESKAARAKHRAAKAALAPGADTSAADKALKTELEDIKAKCTVGQQLDMYIVPSVPSRYSFVQTIHDNVHTVGAHAREFLLMMTRV